MTWNPKRPHIKPHMITPDLAFIRFDNTTPREGITISACALPTLEYAHLLKTKARTVEVRFYAWRRSRPLEYFLFERCRPEEIEFLDGNKLNWEFDNLRVRGHQPQETDWPTSPPLNG